MRHAIKFAGIVALTTAGASVAFVLWRTASLPLDLSSVNRELNVARRVTSVRAVDDFRSNPLTAYPQTQQRPVFFENRRMPEPQDERIEPVVSEPPPPIPVPQLTADHLRLHGVLISHGIRKALIGSSDSEPTWHELGAVIEGWMLAEVSTDRTVLRAGETQVELTLYGQRPNDELTHK